MVFSASLPASAMVSPDCKNENDDENAAVSFREMTRERNERYKTRDEIPQRTKSENNNTNNNNKKS